MSDQASAKRAYDGAGRRARAAETRERVVDAAVELFVERGYVATTIPAIAEHAGVAVETVYRAAPGKAGLLAAGVQSALAGGHERAATAVEDRVGIRRIIDEPDPRRKLEAYAATQPGVWSRVGPLLAVLEAAADGDAELTKLRRFHGQQRLEGMHRFAQSLDVLGALRPGITAERAADVLWALCARANYDALVVERGWSAREYRDWLADSLAASLLGGQRASSAAGR